MREPFEELGSRIIVGSDEEVFKLHYEQDTALCRACGALTIPIKYLGKIVSYFICTQCQLIQYNPKHPFFEGKTEEEILRTEPSDNNNRRTDRVTIKTVKSDSDNPEQLVESVSEQNLRTQIRKSSITQATGIDLRQSYYEDSAEITPTKQPISDQVQYAIEKSLSKLETFKKEKESFDRDKVRELSRP
jgi:hypothetical protein